MQIIFFWNNRSPKSLQIRMQYIWKELKEKEDCELLLDNNSVSDCFASLIAKYKR